MQLKTLKSKLDKMGVTYSVVDYTAYNKSLNFTINGNIYSADYNVGNDNIQSFSQYKGYNYVSEQSIISYFDNFAQLLRSSKITSRINDYHSKINS